MKFKRFTSTVSDFGDEWNKFDNEKISKTELKKISINNDYPDYIIQNKDKLSNWII